MFTRKNALLVSVVLLVLLVLAVAASGCGGADSDGDLKEGSGDDITLRYSYAAGDTWTHELTTVTNGSVEGAGGDDAAVAETTKSRVVTSVTTVDDDGVATLEVTYETLEMTSGGEPVDLTGQEPQKITMTIDKTGKVLSAEGAEGSDAASALMSSGMPLDFADLSNQFSNLMFPSDGTAKVGEQWESTASMPLTGMDQEIAVTTKAELTGVSTENGRETATIDFATTVPMDLTLDLGAMLQAMMEGFGDEDLLGGDMEFVMTLKGDIELPGTATIDRATGQTISTTSEGTMKIEMEITEAPEFMVPESERGPFTMNMTMTMTLIEVR